MASLLSVMTSVIGCLPDRIKIKILAMPSAAPDRGLTLVVEGISNYEARALIDCTVKLEQERTGEVLTPTEYGNRFSGLDLDGAQ